MKKCRSHKCPARERIHGLWWRLVMRVLLAIHDQPYASKQVSAPDNAHQTLLKEHQAWVSVAGIPWAPPGMDRDYQQLVRDVVLPLLDDDCLAMWLVDPSRMLRNNETDRTAWSSARTLSDYAGLGEHAVLSRDTERVDVLGQRALTRAVRRLRSAFRQRTAGDTFEVAADLCVGLSAERLWISLSEITDESRYIGTLVKDSLLVPDLTSARRCGSKTTNCPPAVSEHDGQSYDVATSWVNSVVHTTCCQPPFAPLPPVQECAKQAPATERGADTRDIDAISPADLAPRVENTSPRMCGACSPFFLADSSQQRDQRVGQTLIIAQRVVGLGGDAEHPLRRRREVEHGHLNCIAVLQHRVQHQG